MKALLLIALLPLAAKAQLTIYAVNGTTETSVNSSYSFGQVPLNTTSDAHFRIYNIGSAPVSVNVTLGGAGFTFDSPLLPFVILAYSAVSQTLNITVHFAAASTAGYSASLQINSLSVILLGSGVSAPTLSSVSGCSTGTPFNFGSVRAGSSATCTFVLQNLNPQTITVSSIVINGLGFTGPYGVTAPLTLQAGTSVSFSVNFTPPGAILYTGTLVVGTQSYALRGTGQPPPLPTPSLQFDLGANASAQQRVLTMTIPGGSPVAATGYVNLAFKPSTAVVADDSAIVFLANGSRTIPFSVSVGATHALLNGLGSAAFQTGTTAGTVTFTVTTAAAMTGDPTTPFVIFGAPVMLDSPPNASKARLGWLDITIVGADNTYTTSLLSFSFFDTAGNAISSAVNVDVALMFKTYYATVKAGGSSFRALVSFPVTGSAAAIGSVTVTMTKAAGPASTGRLTFQ
jgi:hypothetical protein